MKREPTPWVHRLRPAGGTSARPASSPELLERATLVIGADAVAWAVEAAGEVVRSVSGVLDPARGSGTGFEREACEACLLTALVGLTVGQEVDGVRTPPEAINQVRMSVCQAVPVATVVRTVWGSHTRVQEALMAEITELVDPSRVLGVVRDVNRWLSEVADIFVRDLMAEHEEELAAWRGRLSQDRSRVLDTLLSGIRPPRAEETLGLRVEGWHLFAHGWQAEEGFIPSADADLARYVADVADVLGANGSLILPHESGNLLWWTTRAEPQADIGTLLRGVGPPSWLRVGVGEPFRGAAGIPDAHRSAMMSGSVAAARATPVEFSDEVRVAALGAQDLDAAGVLVRTVLRGALGDDARTAAARRATLAYLEAGGSRQTAAHRLCVAPNTIASRVDRLSGLLGRPVDRRRLETMLALQLVEQFPGLAHARAERPGRMESRSPTTRGSR